MYRAHGRELNRVPPFPDPPECAGKRVSSLAQNSQQFFFGNVSASIHMAIQTLLIFPTTIRVGSGVNRYRRTTYANDTRRNQMTFNQISYKAIATPMARPPVHFRTEAGSENPPVHFCTEVRAPQNTCLINAHVGVGVCKGRVPTPKPSRKYHSILIDRKPVDIFFANEMAKWAGQSKIKL